MAATMLAMRRSFAMSCVLELHVKVEADRIYVFVFERRLHHVQLRRVRQLYLLEERIVRLGVVTRRVVDVLDAIARADAR